MHTESLLIGVDDGGTCCRARLCSFEGKTLGGGFRDPADIRLELEESLSEVFGAVAVEFARAKAVQ